MLGLTDALLGQREDRREQRLAHRGGHAAEAHLLPRPQPEQSLSLSIPYLQRQLGFSVFLIFLSLSLTL